MAMVLNADANQTFMEHVANIVSSLQAHLLC